MAQESFLPEEYLERRLERRTNQICLTLFVIVMVSVVAAFYVTDRQRAEVRRIQEQVHREFQEAAKRLEQLEKLQQRKQQMLAKVQVSEALLERVPRSLILSELVNRMPLTVRLTELVLETRQKKGVRAAPAASSALEAAKKKAAGGKGVGEGTAAKLEMELPATELGLMLVGTAPTDLEVSQFMSALGQCALFRDVNLVFSEQVAAGEETLRRFRVELLVNQEVDLRAFQPTMVRRVRMRDPMGTEVELRPDGAARSWRGAEAKALSD